MNRAYLIDTASQLKSVSKESAEEYSQKAEILTAQMNLFMLAKPDIDLLVGKNNLDMMKDNHANHIRFMASIFRAFDPDVYVETILWVFRAYRSHGFTTLYWASQMSTWINLLKSTLTPECYQEVYPYYEWIQTNIPILTKVSGEKLDSNKSMH
jgi:hypothetical protein